MIGETIGNFRVIKRLGEGGMGEVFLAEHQDIETKVAIKVLLPNISSQKDHVQRFFNEARAVSKIKHAGIVKIFDVGFHSTGHAYLIMEFLEGESLASRIARTGRLSTDAIADFGRQTASVLAATHTAGITHRDLKPDNIFIVPDHELPSGERIKVLDFGIAKLTGTLAGASPRTLGTMGTPAYMAPEQWQNTSDVDARADLYSLGCVGFEMACGRPPFIVGSIAEACTKHLTEIPPAARTLVPEVPSELDALFTRLLAKQAGARPSMQEVIRTFEAVGSRSRPGSSPAASGSMAGTIFSTPPVASEISPPQMHPRTTLGSAVGQSELVGPARSRRSLMIALGAGAVIIGGAVIFVVANQSEKKDDSPGVAAGPEPDAAAAVVIDAAPPPTLRQRVEAANPFIDVRGATFQHHQVSRTEYRWFLESLPPAEVPRALPLKDWDDGGTDDSRTVAWVTQERARSFCEAIEATLPTSAAWTKARGRSWGLDPSGKGTVGPLQEWTSDVEGGLATVVGGHIKMTAAERKDAIAEPLLKSTEAQAGDGAAPDTVADAMVGFRCMR